MAGISTKKNSTNSIPSANSVSSKIADVSKATSTSPKSLGKNSSKSKQINGHAPANENKNADEVSPVGQQKQVSEKPAPANTDKTNGTSAEKEAAGGEALKDSKDTPAHPSTVTETKEDDDSNNASPTEICWAFIKQYYTLMNKGPKHLHCFYKSKSAMSHGTECEDVIIKYGQEGAHERICELQYKNCKVTISNVDCQSSISGSIVIMVIGELSNNSGPAQRFVQTLVLAEVPIGYFILNDMFRFLKDQVNSKVSEGELKVDIKDGEFNVEKVEDAKSSGLKKDQVSAPKSTQSPATTSDPSSIDASKKLDQAPIGDSEETVPDKVEDRIDQEGDKDSKPIEKKGKGNKKSKNSKNSKLTEGKKQESETVEKTESASIGEQLVKKDEAPVQAGENNDEKPHQSLTESSNITSEKSISKASDLEKPTLPSGANKDTVSTDNQANRGEASNDTSSTSICIRSVKEDTSKVDINEAFSKFGSVRSINFGHRAVYLEFVNADSVAKALSEGQIVIKGHPVQIEACRPRQGNFRGFYNRRGGNHGPRRSNTPSGFNASHSGSDSAGGWTTQRQSSRPASNRGPNPAQ